MPCCWGLFFFTRGYSASPLSGDRAEPFRASWELGSCPHSELVSSGVSRALPWQQLKSRHLAGFRPWGSPAHPRLWHWEHPVPSCLCPLDERACSLPGSPEGPCLPVIMACGDSAGWSCCAGSLPAYPAEDLETQPRRTQW